jgi:hypothetical protein
MGAALLKSGGSRKADERQCKLSVANLVVALKQVGRGRRGFRAVAPSPGVMAPVTYCGSAWCTATASVGIGFNSR